MVNCGLNHECVTRALVKKCAIHVLDITGNSCKFMNFQFKKKFDILVL